MAPCVPSPVEATACRWPNRDGSGPGERGAGGKWEGEAGGNFRGESSPASPIFFLFIPEVLG